MKPQAQPKPSKSGDSRPAPVDSRKGKKTHTSSNNSSEPKGVSHESSKPTVAVDANGWSTFLASVEGDVRSEVRVDSFGVPTFLGDCLSFQNPDPASFSNSQRGAEQEWLQRKLHRFGMVGVRVEIKVPVDHEDAKLTMQKMQKHSLVESLTRALEGQVVGVQTRSEARDV